MAPLRYNRNGMHIIELFAMGLNVSPGTLPVESVPDDEWDCELEQHDDEKKT